MHSRYRLFLFSALCLLTACEDDSMASLAPRAVTAPAGVAATPATPVPTVLTTPVVTASPNMATPPPSSEPTPPAPSPTAATSVALASPGTAIESSASEAATSAATPYQKTGVALDLAVSGPGYFVLATKPNPASVADLLLTRNGHFKLAHDTAGSLSLWRLRHATFDFYPPGLTLSGGTAAGAPEESSAPDRAQLQTNWAGQQTQLLGLVIDAERNIDAPSTARFDFTGRLLLNETAPRGPEGGPVQIYVAIAQVSEPSKLTPQPGFGGIYKYATGAGALQLGVAVSGDGRPVGNANLVLTSTLEQSR